jgi:hypothetical protein
MVVARSDVTLLINLKQISDPHISAQCYTTSAPREIVALMHKNFECETLEISLEISRDIFPVIDNTILRAVTKTSLFSYIQKLFTNTLPGQYFSTNCTALPLNNFFWPVNILTRTGSSEYKKLFCGFLKGRKFWVHY